MKILLTGGNGILGSELKKILSIDNTIESPKSIQMDIRYYCDVDITIETLKPDMIIHCAALKEGRKDDLMSTNINGTYNLVSSFNKHNKKGKFVYISTDYVYPGLTGNYSVNDPVLPINFYAETKLTGEILVKGMQNHLIIRTSFYPKEFPWNHGYVDKFTNKDYVDVIAPLIVDKIISNKTGIINVGTERKSEYELGSRRKQIGKANIIDGFLPVDSSMIIE
jgi:dTDP-4-dehydrorhamnose reductase